MRKFCAPKTFFVENTVPSALKYGILYEKMSAGVGVQPVSFSGLTKRNVPYVIWMRGVRRVPKIKMSTNNERIHTHLNNKLRDMREVEGKTETTTQIRSYQEMSPAETYNLYFNGIHLLVVLQYCRGLHRWKRTGNVSFLRSNDMRIYRPLTFSPAAEMFVS
jgi:hypothetical protein